MRGRTYAAAFAAFAAASLAPAASEVARAATAGDGAAAATIDVIGRRHEAERVERAGHSTVIRPEDASRFDSKAQLERESSLSVPETGRITAAGFAVPRIRGQDARLTEVYVGDLLLQDPYSGLPLIDELDLRAFGEMVFYEGVPPPSLPTLDPIGVIQYRPRPLTKPHAAVIGATYGKPYGISAFWLAEAKLAGTGTPDEARIYLRRHSTNGRYEYLSDNGTPYNTADDRNLTRDNNDRWSNAAMPLFTARLGPGVLKGLLLYQASKTGIPAPNGTQTSLARESASTWLGTLRWQVPLATQGAAPRSLTLSAAANQDTRSTRGLAGTPAGSDATLAVHGAKAGARLAFGDATDELLLGVEESQARVVAATGTGASLTLSRSATNVHIGSTFRPAPPFELEAKVLARVLTDQYTAQATPSSLDTLPQGNKRTVAPGASLAGLWSLGPAQLYVQLARLSRPASLLEEFGDGALILGHPSLHPESAQHQELGLDAQTSDRDGTVHLAIFQDDTLDRIVFVPALAQSLRAQNVGKARIQGAELATTYEIGPTHVFGGITMLKPLDLADPTHATVLPGVAERQASLGLEQKLGRAVALRWTSRYRSDVYRDLQNLIVVPATWISDAYADLSLQLAGTKTQLGLAILNVADVKKLPLEAPGEGGNSGETAYSDLAGYPLPGRQWRLSLAVSF